jgi:hypothetical protein
MTNTSDSISEIARSLGYESASAFTKVFKKIIGCSPRQYSRGQNSVPLAYGEGERANRLQPLRGSPIDFQIDANKRVQRLLMVGNKLSIWPDNFRLALDTTRIVKYYATRRKRIASAAAPACRVLAVRCARMSIKFGD